MQDGELPEGWGLLVPRGGGIAQKIAPQKLEPQPVTRAFLAAIMRKVDEQGIDEILINKARAAGYKNGYESAEREVEAAKRDVRELEKKISEFHAASGVRIDGWEGAGRIGSAVRAVLDGVQQRDLEELSRVRETATRIVELVDESMSAVRENINAKKQCNN